MPELPEVQTIVDDLNMRAAGRVIRNVEFLTPSIWKKSPPDRDSLLGARIMRFERVGKNILIVLSNDYTIIGHLKMTGRLTVNNKKDPVVKHTHLILKFPVGELRFNDIRRFGYFDLVESSKLNRVEYLASLGPDAMTISEPKFVDIVKSRDRTIKSLLLDQSVISGLGNIYTDESLFAAGINPSRPASGLSMRKLKKLHLCMREIIADAIRSRGSSVSDYVDGSGNLGSFQRYHKVYGRTGEACVVCGRPIRRKIIAGRSSHYCPRCQR